MKKVAKLIMIDADNQYLVMIRNNHPAFGDDVDLPGGTIEGDESALEGMIREVKEEAGVVLDQSVVKKLYEGLGYSRHKTEYSLFVVRVENRPKITISWEHSGYQWVNRDTFISIASAAHDTYMHMVADVVRKQEA